MLRLRGLLIQSEVSRSKGIPSLVGCFLKSLAAGEGHFGYDSYLGLGLDLWLLQRSEVVRVGSSATGKRTSLDCRLVAVMCSLCQVSWLYLMRSI